MFERLRGVGGKSPSGVDSDNVVHEGFYRPQTEHRVDDRSDFRCDSPHFVGRCQHAVAQRNGVSVIAYARVLDDVADPHSGWTCNLATFAVQTHFQRLVVEFRRFQPVSLAIGPSLFGAWIEWIDRKDRTIDGAYGAFYALFEIVATYVLYLIFHLKVRRESKLLEDLPGCSDGGQESYSCSGAFIERIGTGKDRADSAEICDNRAVA